MEVSKESLIRIMCETTCAWTKGYLACILDAQAPSRHQIAREIIDACGPNQKILAIKKVRENYGLGLKEAKDLVDHYFATGEIIGLPDDPDDPPAMVGRR